MTTPLDEALAEARKTLALCDVLDAPASSETRARWERIEAALLRAQRIEAAAVQHMRQSDGLHAGDCECSRCVLALALAGDDVSDALAARRSLPVIATCGRCPVHADFGPEYSHDVAEAMGPWSPNGTQWACGNDAELRSTRPDEAPPAWCSLRGAP